MNNLLISLKIVAPIFLYLVTGYVLRYTRFFDEHTRKNMNQLVTNVGLPAMLLVNTYKSDFRSFADWKTLLYTCGGVLLIFLITFFIVPRLLHDRLRSASVIHSLFRGNTSIYGLPVAQSLLGANGDFSTVLAVIALTIVTYNILGVITLTTMCQKKHGRAAVLLNIIKTPMLIGAVVGIALSLSKIVLPAPVIEFASGLSALTTPVAFLCLGASFQFKMEKSIRTLCLSITAIRLLIIPVIFMTIGILLFDFRGASLAALIAVFATPCAVNTYPLASAYGADDTVAGTVLIYETALSVLTLFIFIFLLKSFALF